jgi:hydrophobic/amphiphilic exporter-1 (mainly G- bacteria), HAE1 family
MRVAADVRDRLDGIRATLPDGVTLSVTHDESESVADELEVLARRSALSLGLILLVLLAARRGARPSVVVLTSVVFSALATFLVFRFLDLGLNLVTLSGLALAFGMAVDNSIVLLESVAHRCRGRRFSPVRTLAAVREVLFPLLAATATTAVVTLPFLYLEGDLRDAYLPFVLAVVVSLVASLAVALTWTPLLAKWALRERGTGVSGRGALPGRVDAALLRGFDRTLGAFLRRPWLPVAISALVLAAAVWVFREKVAKGSIFSPQPDTTLTVSIGLPPGARIERTDELLRTFEDAVLTHEFRAKGWVKQVDAFVTTDRGNLTVRFPDVVAWTTVPAILKEELTMRAATISGADVSVTGQGPGFSRSRSRVTPSYQLRLTGPDYGRLATLTDGVAAVVGAEPRVRDLDTNGAGMFIEDARELVLIPDRDRIAAAGLTMRAVVDAIRPAIAADLGSRRFVGPDGPVTGRVRFEGGEDLVVPELLELLVTTPSGVRVPLRELARVEERGLPGEIRRRDQRYERQIRFEYRGPRRVGDRFVKSLVENTVLPPGYAMKDGLGLFLTAREESDIRRGIVLSLVLVMIVSAALFESLVLPFVAVLSVPLSFAAIPFTFWATGESFDRTAYVGLILLAGIAINNALLLVHRAGRLHRRLGDAGLASRRAARERLRPILLTTLTSVAGLVPLMHQGTEAMAGTWRSLALAATAGLLASAAFTLLVIPCLFTLLARGPRRGSRAWNPIPIPRGETA